MQSFTMEVGGRALTIEHGKMAKQANGAVLIRYGDTVVLVTATASTAPTAAASRSCARQTRTTTAM